MIHLSFIVEVVFFVLLLFFFHVGKDLEVLYYYYKQLDL